MADERYQKILGIEPTDELPTYYELLALDPSEHDGEVIEKAYKTQIRKAQEIRTSKDKGFIEFLKEELRKARRTLTDAERRKAYDDSLLEDAIDSFQGFVKPFMGMGTVVKAVYDTMLGQASVHGLTEERAKQLIEEMAKETGATVQTEEPAPEPEPEPEPAPAAPAARAGGEVVLEAPEKARGITRRSSFYAGNASDFYTPDTQDAAPSAPARPGHGRGPHGRGRSAPDPRRDPALRKKLDEARQLFNLGAKLAKIATEVHDKLRHYFPPANHKNTRTYQINGVSYEKVFETEQKTLRDSLKKFEGAQGRVERIPGPHAERIRSEASRNITMVKGYLDEMRRHKMRLMGGLSQAEEMKAWQEFVNAQRSPRLSKALRA